MSGHTPGPWVLRVQGQDAYIDAANGSHYELAVVVWQMDDDRDLGISSPTAEANARLITAAPDLLEALQEADRLYSTYALTATGGLEVGRWINAARDAIAKATGATP